MNIEFKYNKTRIILGRLLLLFLAVICVLYPKVLQRTILITEIVFFTGCITVLWISLDIIGFIILFSRNNIGIIITKEQLIDYSKYQSFGRIPCDEITYIKEEKSYYGKKYLEIGISESFSHTIELNLLQKILLWFYNYGDKSKIILSNATLLCKEKELEEVVIFMYNSKKN